MVTAIERTARLAEQGADGDCTDAARLHVATWSSARQKLVGETGGHVHSLRGAMIPAGPARRPNAGAAGTAKPEGGAHAI